MQGQRQVSKSYEYKIKSILKKKISVLLERDLPLLSDFFPEMNIDIINNKTVKEVKDLTKFSKTSNGNTLNNLTKISKEKDTLSKPIKLVACEGLEGSKHSLNGYKHEKTTEIKDLSMIPENKAPGEGFEPGV